VPEVIEQGVSGFIVEGIEEAVDAVHNIGSLSREFVRKRFEQRFTIERVARDYVRVYESLGAEPTLPVLRRRAA
jgi:glycosyltransferase involved in cell wall biosynthesis